MNDFKWTGCEGADWNHVTQNGVLQWVLVNTDRNLKISQMTGNFLTSCATASSWKDSTPVSYGRRLWTVLERCTRWSTLKFQRRSLSHTPHSHVNNDSVIMHAKKIVASSSTHLTNHHIGRYDCRKLKAQYTILNSTPIESLHQVHMDIPGDHVTTGDNVMKTNVTVVE